ncbi:hypothetical protein ABFS82_12G043400 [Erythranthe guttata]|uniref:Peptidase metallopeptidase domain-containing protein n=2 Tax=Erythranthe guttata TaxID=4155 RepID=A0A022PP28_ERYGU|nr:PREDICTED: metalloendoproteinase 1-like [Erythranthe guttata]EYU18042.1 hypothetical protein MIMGU_mgv1a018853mg [Erythranthe guttata]|eukprot:XP_012828828.1 PREDICTED: metalloendoproteinase 1-like [Erythranthe guttata]
MTIQHFFPIFLISLICLSSIGYALRVIPLDEILSPFDFIKILQGSVKGDRTLGISGLKSYLQKFGYLENLNNTQVNNVFDDALESAIKTYQQNFNINPTGILDAATVSTMIIPRCGVPDIINVSHYTFFLGNPKWPASKYNLTYEFLSNVPSNAVAPVERAFQNWDNATHFTFRRSSSDQTADLIIEFQRGYHGDGASFDGPGGTLAHAFAPTNGRFHYDADERWSVDPVANTFHLETVALHEIGHLLGLGHSSIQAAIMYPSVSAGTAKIKLNTDDIQGIKALYTM